MNNSLRNSSRLLWAGLRALLVLSVITGVLYPLAVTGAAQALFPDQADGSRVEDASGEVVGSELIGQRYDVERKKGDEATSADLRWFQPRPSGGLGVNSVNTRYDLLLSGATNRSGDNEELVRWVKDAKAAVVKDNSLPGHPIRPSDVPAEAVTSSGSGLDPHISPEYAELQAHRVAVRNSLPAAQVEQLVTDHTDHRILGFIGEPRVNVLELNVALRELVQNN